MPQPYPLPRSYREAGPYDFDGVSTVYGPFGAPSQFSIFDPEDVVVEVRESAAAGWAEVPATIAKTYAAALSPFTVTFAEVFPATHDFRFYGRRLHERSLDVTKGNSLSADKLELELSKQGVCLQELRRDIDISGAMVNAVLETVTAAIETTAVAAGAAAHSATEAADSATLSGGHADAADASVAAAAAQAAAAHSSADSAATTVLALSGALTALAGAFSVDADGHLIVTFAETAISAIAVDDDTGHLKITYGDAA